MGPCGGRGVAVHCGALLACNRPPSARKKACVCIRTLVHGMAPAHSMVLVHGMVAVHDKLELGRSRGLAFHNVQLGSGSGESPRRRGILCSCGGSFVEVVEVVEVVEGEEGAADGMASHGAFWHNDELACGGHGHGHDHDHDPHE